MLADTSRLGELTALGFCTVPVVALANDAVHGVDLHQVAQLVGFEYEAKAKLNPTALNSRQIAFLTWLNDAIDGMPAAVYEIKVPGRERTVWNLVDHVCEISFVYHRVADRLTPFDAIAAAAEVDAESTNETIHASLTLLRRRYAEEIHSYGADVETYFGTASLHYVLERCTWHTAQHLRQIHSLGSSVAAANIPPLDEALFTDLPLAKEVWD